MSSIEMFNASIFVSEQLEKQLLKTAEDLAHRCIMECGKRYGFDADEAVRFLGLSMLKVERKAQASSVAKASKVVVSKSVFPLPYNGELNDSLCYALRQNNGLYTQCPSVRNGSSEFCKSCANQMQKTGCDVPEYGTIQMRQAVGIFEYVDPKGRKPSAYTKVMKKYKLTREQVMEEADKLNIKIDENHFVEPEDSKRGRPKAEKVPKEKGVKGRPKKEKKVLEVEGDDEDLFATLVAQANEESEIIPKKKQGKSDEEKEAERIAKEQEKETKRLAAEQAKAEKEAKIAAEKAEKEAKKKAEEEEKAAKKLAVEQAKKEKEEKKLAKEEAKKEKEEKKLAQEQAKKEKEEKKAKKAEKPTKKADKVEVPEEEEPDVVKKIEFEGIKYLKSKKTGIVYDYNEYVKNGEQVVVGKWNETSNKIEFEKDNGEESEDEYDM